MRLTKFLSFLETTRTWKERLRQRAREKGGYRSKSASNRSSVATATIWVAYDYFGSTCCWCIKRECSENSTESCCLWGWVLILFYFYLLNVFTLPNDCCFKIKQNCINKPIVHFGIGEGSLTFFFQEYCYWYNLQKWWMQHFIWGPTVEWHNLYISPRLSSVSWRSQILVLLSKENYRLQHIS